MKTTILFFIIVFFGFTVLNNDRQVNTYTKSYQREPVIAIDKIHGKYIIAWTSNTQDGDKEGIFAQYFDKHDNKLGNEFQINTTIKGDQNKPAIDMNTSGDCIVVWASSSDNNNLQDIFGQLIDKNNRKKGKEFLVNTTTLKSQNCPDVAIDDNGNFVVVWHSWDQDGGDRGIYGQMFKKDGSKSGNEFLINSCTPYSQAEPSIDMRANGDFVVTWQSWKQENPSSDDYGIYAQIFNSKRLKLGDEIHVNTSTEYDQFYPDIVIAKNGEFIITWTSWIPYNPKNRSEKPYFSEIYAQRFDHSGEKIGFEILVNTTILEYQWLSSVAINTDGSFAIAWSSWKQDGDREGVYIQFFDKRGKMRGTERQVNSFTSGYQWEPQLVFNDRNEVLISWSSWGQDGDDYGIFSKRISGNK